MPHKANGARAVVGNSQSEVFDGRLAHQRTEAEHLCGFSVGSRLEGLRAHTPHYPKPRMQLLFGWYIIIPQEEIGHNPKRNYVGASGKGTWTRIREEVSDLSAISELGTFICLSGRSMC